MLGACAEDSRRRANCVTGRKAGYTTKNTDLALLKTQAWRFAEAASAGCLLPGLRRHRQFPDPGRGCFLQHRIISETFEPVDFRFATEPSHLALGVVAMGLLDLGNGG